MSEGQQSARVRNRRVHLANERTFLAWIRTSIGIMAFGFVVEKFALFIKQMSYLLGRSAREGLGLPGEIPREFLSHGYSSFLGIFLVGLGAIIGMLAFVRFKRVEKQIDDDTYRPSTILDIMLAIAVLSIATFLIVYLIHSI
jgi:putative membrane protein